MRQRLRQRLLVERGAGPADDGIFLYLPPVHSSEWPRQAPVIDQEISSVSPLRGQYPGRYNCIYCRLTAVAIKCAPAPVVLASRKLYQCFIDAAAIYGYGSLSAYFASKAYDGIAGAGATVLPGVAVSRRSLPPSRSFYRLQRCSRGFAGRSAPRVDLPLPIAVCGQGNVWSSRHFSPGPLLAERQRRGRRG